MIRRTLGGSPRCSRLPPSRALASWITRFWHVCRARVVRTSERVARSFAGSVVAVAFWVAVAVPFLTLAHLASGLHSSGDVAVFVTLVTVNLVALGVGHRYRHPDTGASVTTD